MSVVDAELEPELNVWLAKHFPDLDRHVEPATPDDIAAMERYAGRPLPRFYRWFLARMGRDNAPFAARTLDFRVGRILRCYEDGTFARNSRFLVVGYETNAEFSEHFVYDFDHPARDDARLAAMSPYDDEPDWPVGYETFRDFFVQMVFYQYLLAEREQQVVFTLEAEEGGAVHRHADPILASLGFVSPVAMGPYARFYESGHQAAITSASLDPPGPSRVRVRVGCDTVHGARAIMDRLAAHEALTVRRVRWEPELDA
ncbi:MAG: hypothetical protein R3A79_19425 [Nannocystaceae bacterium]